MSTATNASKSELSAATSMASSGPSIAASSLSATTSMASGGPSTATDASRATATKRKLADAFQTLDAAVEATPPAKKAHTARSLYATLAKYGVKPKQANPHFAALSKSTPHLTAILARAASRTRKALPFASSSTPLPPLPPTAEYRPSSIPSFLARLATFKLATYANKPSQLDAVAAAKCGWINDGKDRLVCGLCSVSWVVAGREGMSRDAANALVEKQRVSLVEAHKTGCPWKTRQCDPSIYRIPLQAPAVMVREIKTTAAVLHPIMQQMEVKHPLTASQLASLRATVTAFVLPPPEEDAPPPPDPSETAVLTALFGWAPAPPATERPRVSSLSRTSSRTASRAGSPFPSTPPRLARASTPPRLVRASTSALAEAPVPPSTPPRQFLRRISGNFSLTKRDTALLHCALCQRRVGLWAFAPPTEPSTPPPSARAPAPQRHFDLLKEHRSFCPYVVRSTLVPTLPAEPVPSPTAGVLEGWRAVLAVVLRYGMGQRQRTTALRRRQSTDGNGDTAMDVDGDADGGSVDGVEAMVEGVKARGGKELLRYVKGLLG
ncbi:C3HC zinc finger-like-domain-containing protein [Mycena capillaripes]|nr:C3HC zinc finger-like-domain-containing protein [Mycena capillaripes]